MTSNTFPRLRRLCDALPKTKYDKRFESLSTLQRLLALAVASIVVLTVPPLLVDSSGGRVVVAVALAFGILYSVSTLIVRYNRP